MDRAIKRRVDNAIDVMMDVHSSLDDLEKRIEDMRATVNDLKGELQELKRQLFLLPKDVFKKDVIYRPSDIVIKNEDDNANV